MGFCRCGNFGDSALRRENRAGGRFWPAKPKIEPRGFGFALEHANPGADQRVVLCGSVGVDSALRGENRGGEVLACKTENRTARVRIWSGTCKSKRRSKGGCMGFGRCGNFGDGALRRENHAGGRFWPAKPKIEPRGFGFGLEHANPSADRRVGVWGSVGVVISVTAHCVGEIARRAGFGL